MYNFDVPWAIAPEIMQAAHAAEVSHVFGNPVEPDEASRAVGQAMNAYWAAFAATGNPNHDGAPAAWPNYEPEEAGGDRRLQLDEDFEVIDGFREDECTFWREHRAGLDSSP
jgi:para-nitrobenzyl esterase